MSNVAAGAQAMPTPRRICRVFSTISGQLRATRRIQSF